MLGKLPKLAPAPEKTIDGLDYSKNPEVQKLVERYLKLMAEHFSDLNVVPAIKEIMDETLLFMAYEETNQSNILNDFFENIGYIPKNEELYGVWRHAIHDKRFDRRIGSTVHQKKGGDLKR